MTLIVGLSTPDGVWMGADSSAIAGYDRHITKLRKLFYVQSEGTGAHNRFLIGYTSSFRMGQILQHHLHVRTQEAGEDTEHYLVTAFIESVRETLKVKGFSNVKENNEVGGTFLVGYRGNVYQVDSDFQINHYRNGIAVSGAGDTYAMGALLAMPDVDPRTRIKQAMKIAAELSMYVAPPFVLGHLSCCCPE